MSLDQGDELIADNLLQNIAYEDYLAEGDRLVALINAGLCGQETFTDRIDTSRENKETDAGIIIAALREFFPGVSAQYTGLASMIPDIFPGDSI